MSEFNRHALEGYPDQLEEAKELFSSAADFGPSLEALKEQCAGDENLQTLLDDMLDSCYRYVEDVFKMEMMVAKGVQGPEGKEELARVDKNRTLMHNAVISNVNIFSRALAKAKKEGNKKADNEWVRPLAAGGRAAYMRFAIFIALSEYLRNTEEKPEMQGGIQ